MAAGGRYFGGTLPDAVVAPVFRLHHRGFSLLLSAGPTADGVAYGFHLAQHEQPLHASGPVYATLAAADRAGRRFVDDALNAYTWAAEWMDAPDWERPAYSSSK